MAKTSVEHSTERMPGETSERRKSERTGLVVRVDYRTVDELFTEFTQNINEGGLFVETETPHPTGTVVWLQFRVPGSDDPLDVEGRVVWTQDSSSGESSGMGIEFDDLDRQARERINHLVRQLRADATRAF
jgi:type IV pilus assembly protein PilZ